MIAQSSGFTVSGWMSRILEVDGKILHKVELPVIARSSAATFLREAGISSASVFPDLQGISLQIGEELKNEIEDGLRVFRKKSN